MKPITTLAVRAGPGHGPSPGCGDRSNCRAASEGKTGFTLIELLVVISILALLVSILVPSLQKAQELARRVKCAANLNGIGKALALYANDQRSYPYVPLNGAGWGVAVGTARDTDPFAGAAVSRNPTSCLYLLVRAGMAGPEMFICPSSQESAGSDSGGLAKWDFADGKRASYALQNPYGPVRRFSQEVTVPVLADASPYFDPATGLRNSAAVVDLSTATSDQVLKGNSPNHRQEGQNVAVFGGSTAWYSRADVGSDNDNIYTRSAKPATGDPGGTLPAAASDGAAADQGPANDSDSYLLP